MNLKHNSILIVCCILITSLSSILFSDDEKTLPIQIQVSAGFDGKYKEHSWFPVIIQASNRPPSEQSSNEKMTEFEGTLEITTTVTNNQKANYIKEIKLPVFSNKKYIFYIKGTFDGRIEITLKDKKEKEYLSNTVALSQIPISGKIILLIGSPETQIFFNSPNHFNGFSAVAKPNPQDLPDKWYGYSGVDLVIISDYQKRQLSDEQSKALDIWIKNGGKVIVSVGTKWQLFKDTFIEDMLPVDLTGSTTISSLQIFNNQLKNPEGDIVVSTSNLKKGVIINKIDNVPLIVKHKYGLGEVFYSAFDIDKYPFRAWEGQDMFWLSFLKNNNQHTLTEFATGFLRQFINKTKALEPPNIEVIGIILLLYLIIVSPLNFLILKRKKKLELAWITIPVIVIIFSISIYLYSLIHREGDLLLRNIAIINTTQNSKYAKLNGLSFIFTPKRDKFNIMIKDKGAVVSEEYYWLNRQGKGLNPYVRRTRSVDYEIAQTLDESDDIFSIKNKKMTMVESLFLESHNHIELDGTIDADLKFSDNSLYGTILNNTKYDIKDCLFLCGTLGTKLGDLNSGQKIDIQYTLEDIQKFKPPNILSLGSRNSASSVKDQDEIREIKKSILEVLYIPSKNEFSQDGIFSLIGWVEGDWNKIDLNKNIGKKEDINLFIAQLDCELVQSNKSGKLFYLPPNLVKRTILDYKSNNISLPHMKNGFFSQQYSEPIKLTNGYITFSYESPFYSNKIKLSDATILTNLSNNSEGSYLYNFTDREWENINLPNQNQIQLSSVRNEINKQKYSTEKIFNSETEELLLKLDFEKPNQQQWGEIQIHNVDVSFIGEKIK